MYINFAVFCCEIGQDKAAKEAVINVLQMQKAQQLLLRKDVSYIPEQYTEINEKDNHIYWSPTNILLSYLINKLAYYNK